MNTPMADCLAKLNDEVKKMEKGMDAARKEALVTPASKALRRPNSSPSSESSQTPSPTFLTQFGGRDTSDETNSDPPTPKVSLFGVGGVNRKRRKQPLKDTDSTSAPKPSSDSPAVTFDTAENSDESSTVHPTYPVQQCYSCSKSRTTKHPLQPCPHCDHLHHPGCLHKSGNCFDCYTALASDSSVQSNSPSNNRESVTSTQPDSPTQTNPSSPSGDEVEVEVIDSPPSSNHKSNAEQNDSASSPAHQSSSEEADLSDDTDVQQEDTSIRPPVPRRQPIPAQEEAERPSSRPTRLMRKATRNHPHATRSA